mmetsp:Transcript_30147/g.85125  ORF Transcript_30147/g.85125 Transcript_30147/m.85125 type:complete len:94 (+) Transcript_30147:657-938(+)
MQKMQEPQKLSHRGVQPGQTQTPWPPQHQILHQLWQAARNQSRVQQAARRQMVAQRGIASLHQTAWKLLADQIQIGDQMLRSSIQTLRGFQRR